MTGPQWNELPWLACAGIMFAMAAWGQPSMKLSILDEKGRPAAARVQAFDVSNKPLPFAGGHLSINPKDRALGIVVDGQAEIVLPVQATRLRVSRGTEYVPFEIRAGLQTQLSVRLRRWIDMASKGWWSGDMHVHRLASDVAVLMRAAVVHFAPDITCWNDQSHSAVWPDRRVSEVEHQPRLFRPHTAPGSFRARLFASVGGCGRRTPAELQRTRSRSPR